MIKAFKGLSIKIVDGEPVLYSPSVTDYEWVRGENTAIGYSDGESGGGFYALKSDKGKVANYIGSGVLCELLMWGKYTEGELGYKSEKAAVNAIFIPSVKPIPVETLFRLADRYGVPLVKADGAAYNIICNLRTENLIREGKLPLVRAQREYRKQWSWMEDKDHRYEKIRR